MNRKIENFKKSMHDTMLINFKNDGHLAPIFFMLMNTGLPAIGLIPREYLEPDNKVIFAKMIKKWCQDPTVIAAGMIVEAFGAEFKKDDKLSELVQNGEIKVSELKEKKDIIFMIFSTPEKEEIFIYQVDEKTKSIGKKFCEGECNNFSGIFSNLFAWNKN